MFDDEGLDRTLIPILYSLYAHAALGSRVSWRNCEGCVVSSSCRFLITRVEIEDRGSILEVSKFWRVCHYSSLSRPQRTNSPLLRTSFWSWRRPSWISITKAICSKCYYSNVLLSLLGQVSEAEMKTALIISASWTIQTMWQAVQELMLSRVSVRYLSFAGASRAQYYMSRDGKVWEAGYQASGSRNGRDVYFSDLP